MVFTKDGTQYVGRIVARGGDTVEVTDEATLVVNGSTVLESSIYYTTPKYDDGPAYPVTLAADEFFCPVRLPRGRARQPLVRPRAPKRGQGQGHHGGTAFGVVRPTSNPAACPAGMAFVPAATFFWVRVRDTLMRRGGIHAARQG